MEMTPEELLAGPRGRLLCLAAAVPDGPPIWWPADVAAVLDRSETGEITDTTVCQALVTTVDAARYWQEPEAEERELARPAVREALLPIAEQIVALPRARSWSASRATEQWVIDWRDEDDSAPITRTTPGRLQQWGRAVREGEARAARERPSDPTANFSGEWWSSPFGAAHSVSRVPEALDLIEDSLGWESATLIPVRGVGRTYEIRTPEDWTRLCREHPLEVTASRRHDWFRVTGRNGAWVIPDWEDVAGLWDAVHLTVAGYLSAATRELPVDAERSSMIAGWNPGTTYWLTDSLREWEGPRRRWRRNRESYSWVLDGTADAG